MNITWKVVLIISIYSFWLVACTNFLTAKSPSPTAAPLTEPKIEVVAQGLIAPIGMAVLPGGDLLIAEAGTGRRDKSAGVSLLASDGSMGRLISGLPSSRDAGDLAGVNSVALAPGGDKIYLGNFSQGHLWTLPLNSEGLTLPETALSPAQLTPVMTRLNNVFLVNPFDITFDAQGTPVVSDASANGVAKENPDGTTRFIHRFNLLPDPSAGNERVTIDPVPTGITRIGEEYYVTLTGGCPYPAGGGQLVAIDEERHQRTVAEGLNMPIDVAQGSDGTIWVLEFARFTPNASCFTGEGYQANTGRLSRLQAGGSLEPVLTGLNFPGAILPLSDGTFYISEVFSGRVLHVTLP